jgi:hypothetical protein
VDGSETWRDQRERRYQLDRDQALAVLRALAGELPAVTYWPGSARTLVVTTYLDSPARDYLRMIEESGGRVSLKVRIREYLPILDGAGVDGDGNEPRLGPLPTVFLERKERIGELRQKLRVKLDKRQVGAVLRRQVSVRGDADVVAALEGELALRALEPVLVSVYERRVFGADRGGLRITFDERLRFHGAPEGLYDVHPALEPAVLGDVMAPGPPRILEIKESAGQTSPRWLDRLLAGLPAVSGYSKFRDGMVALRTGGERRPLTRPLLAIK